MEWLQNFHFLRPYWLAALILPLAAGFYAYKNEAAYSSWAKVCDKKLLDFLLVKGQNGQRRLPYVLLLLIMISGVIALAGPSWNKKQNPALSVDNPVMFLVDMSPAMSAKDVSPSRSARAGYVVSDLLDMLSSTETGLAVYSGEPFVISPLTEDTELIKNLLLQLDEDVLPSGGDRPDRAVDSAVARMRKAGFEKGNIILLTSDAGERFDKTLESAAKAAAEGVDVNVIKVGGEDEEKLKMTADKGKGIYLDYRQNPQKLAAKINDIYAKELKQSENMQTVWEDAGYYLFWLPALLLLYYFRRGVLLVLAVLLLGAKVSYAGWFLTDNQEAMRAFEKKNYDEAAEKFDMPQWKAAALYKKGDFENAYKHFSGQNDAVSVYNQGNALAKSGKISEAIKKYEEVLTKEPDFEDARYNLEYLKKLQQQQQSQNSQSGQNSQNQNKNDKKSNDGNAADKNQSGQEQAQQSEQQKQQQQQNGGSGEQNKEQNANKSEKPQKGSGNQQQKTDSAEQNGTQKQNSDGSGSDDEQKDASLKESQSAAGQNEDQSGGKEAEANVQARQGEEDRESEQTAKAVRTQAGAKSDKEKRELKARLQKFRDVPEDKGGLLRAMIKKEYDLNRYKDR